jgi:uncharacterized RDD family membrane protein YckC
MTEMSLGQFNYYEVRAHTKSISEGVRTQGAQEIDGADVLFRRVAALIIDHIILAIVVVPSILIDERTIALVLIFIIGYFPALEALCGATPGKSISGIKVIDGTGDPPRLRNCVVRHVFRLVDVWPTAYILGGSVVLISRNHQRIGDMIAGTYVVRA